MNMCFFCATGRRWCSRIQRRGWTQRRACKLHFHELSILHYEMKNVYLAFVHVNELKTEIFVFLHFIFCLKPKKIELASWVLTLMSTCLGATRFPGSDWTPG